MYYCKEKLLEALLSNKYSYTDNCVKLTLSHCFWGIVPCIFLRENWSLNGASLSEYSFCTVPKYKESVKLVTYISIYLSHIFLLLYNSILKFIQKLSPDTSLRLNTFIWKRAKSDTADSWLHITWWGLLRCWWATHHPVNKSYSFLPWIKVDCFPFTKRYKTPTFYCFIPIY